ncbi:ATP synthase F1 subunit epsilon [Arabiibacter massiliensis]|uniref:ATP synthase F1 subunit epsilon n=1 Tax=Arabiibacter massiliensis TaxID=1870985 RepID=UPI0009BA59C9|nr:ATP synthase F1 subunit epsilon [Arabiibacter massiliensis]
MAGFTCDIVTPVAKLVSEEATLVVVPGVEGEMGFLKGHAPLVSVLADGEARMTAADGQVKHYALQGGYVEVGDDKVIILADRALPSAEIDVAQVRERLSAIEAELSELSEDIVRKTTLTADKAWCEVQLKVAKAA